jgi:preprotein translocase subunit SecG
MERPFRAADARARSSAVQSILLAIELFVAVALVVVIMLQRSEGGALGIGGGGGSGFGGLFSPRGAADTLTRTTTILAAAFFAICIILDILSLRGRDERSFFDTAPPPASTAPAAPKPLAPAPAVPNRH